MAKGQSGVRPWLVAALILVGIVIVCAIAAWVFRKPAATALTERWCRSQQFECTLEVTQLGLSGLEVESLKMVAANGDVPFEASHARIELEWPSLFSPAPTRVTLKSPVLRGQYQSEGEIPVRFSGLEDLIPSGGSSSAAPPDVAIEDARFELATPAGPLVATGQFEGSVPFNGDAYLEIQPTKLASGDAELELRKAVADLSITGLRVDGTIAVELVEVAFDGLAAENLTASLDMAGTLQPAATWSFKADELSYRDLSLTGADLSGEAQLRAPGMDKREGALSTLQSFALSGTIRALAAPDVTAGETSVSVEATRESSSRMEADYAFEIQNTLTAGHTTDRATLTGHTVVSDTLEEFESNGDFIAEGISLSSDVRDLIESKVNISAPLEGHSEALANWLVRTASQFTLGGEFDARWAGEADWSLVAHESLNLRAANGSTLSLRSEDTHPALNLSPDGLELSGLLSLAGGSAPRLAAHLKTVRIGPDRSVDAQLGGVSLKPWTADDLTLAGEFNEIDLSTAGAAPRIKAVGEISVDGTLYGMDHENTRLFGGFDAVLDAAGIRVQSFKTRCLGLDTRAIAVGGGFGIGDTALQLCPVDGRLVSRTAGVASGRFEMGTVSVPFSSQSTEGVLTLEQGLLDWRAGERASISIRSDRMSLPLTIGGKTLSVSSTEPLIGLESGALAKLSAHVGFSEFSGSSLPADISLASAKLDARLASSGLDGTADAVDVQVSDRNDDPLYEPLTGQLSGSFEKGVMTVKGPVTTPRAGQPIADVELTLDLSTLDGSGRVSIPPLEFEPGRLQPTALSDRVRGFLSNARGQMAGEAIIDIDGGSASGTGWVSVTDFGFDTLRVGAVSGVEGRIEFDDIMELTTPPAQQVRIGRISPGIPLEDGLVEFQLLGPTEAVLETARWPFAGGELVAGRSTWTIAGARDVISIKANALELTRLINVFNLPDIKADGTVSGEFPVEIAGPNAYIRNATLKADDEGGLIAYTGKAAESASQADSRAKMAFDALRDFRFSVLEIGANGNLSGDMLITMKLVGYSPTVLEGAPFAFNIGVDSKLMQLIQTGQRATSSEWLADAVSSSVSSGNTSDGEDEN